MVTMAQRIEELRMAKAMSRPALAAALGLPKTAIEKFETGRQTPTKEQQEKLAAFFGVSLFYLRGESGDKTKMEDWMDGAFLDAPQAAAPVSRRAPKAEPAPSSDGQGSLLDSLIGGKKFQESLRAAVRDVLGSPEGQEILARAIRRELATRK